MAFLRDPEVRQCHIVCVEEPWRNKYHNGTFTLNNIWHLVHRQELGTRVAIFVSAEIDIEKWVSDTSMPDLCYIIFNLEILGVQQKLKVTNVYNLVPLNRATFRGPFTLTQLEVELTDDC
jgi:hypothetical protein